MNESLAAWFEKALNFDTEKQISNQELEAQVSKAYSPEQRSQVEETLQISQRFPETLNALNGLLQNSTFLLSAQVAGPLDSVVFSRVQPYIRQFSEKETIANRHVVRWADLIQSILAVPEKFKVDYDLNAPRELKLKERKDAKTAVDERQKPENSDLPKPAKDAAAISQETKGQKDGVKKEKNPKTQKKPASSRPLSTGQIDLRVGFIEKAVKHPDADTLYVSTIHVGEDEPRTICSGLVNYIPIEKMQQRYVVVVANLKPVKMRGISSAGMVLCASDEKANKVEFVNPPEGSKAGDKLFFEGNDEEPEPVLNPKKKIWEQLQPHFTTTTELEVVYRSEGQPDRKLVNRKGQTLKVTSLSNATVR